MKLLKLSLLMLFVLIEISLSEQACVVEGIISDKSDERVIPGASIRILGTNRGTYSSSKGFFRLNVVKGDSIVIRSLAYLPDTLVITQNENDLKIRLKSIPILTGNVNVTADITAEQIIERAINRRDMNQNQLKTFKGDLYSKLIMENEGSLLSISSDEDGSVTAQAAIGFGDEPSDSKKYVIMETFSSVMKDYKENISSTTINKRRQTANLKPDDNLMAVTEFFSFYDDEISFLNVTFPSPIASKALSAYNYRIKKKINQNGRYIYVLSVEPNSSIYPRFTGEIHIVEGTYNVVEIDLEPSISTAVPFFEKIKIKQKYSESEEKVWYPSFLEVNAGVKVDVLKGVFDFKTDIQVTSIFSDASINIALPDSFYSDNFNVSRITISNIADSPDSTFWKRNSLHGLGDKEDEIYKKVEHAVKSDSASFESSISEVRFNWLKPYFDFNRVSSVSLGLMPSLQIHEFKLNTNGYYSFGLQDFYGSVGLELPTWRISKYNVILSGNIYSGQERFGHSIGQYHRLVNTVAAALVHEDYNDYYQNDGFGISLNISSRRLDFLFNADFSRNYSLKKNTDKSIFRSYEWRNNPAVEEGNFSILRAKLTLGKIIPISLPDYFDAELDIDAFAGLKSEADLDFRGISGRLIFSVPTFETGYGSMKLMMSLSGGIVSDDTPVQYQHRMASRLFILNNTGNFYTAQIGFYGGDKYYSVQILYNLSDIWWRWLGLPTFEGRGVELTLGGTYGEFYNSTGSFYRGTGKDAYSEAGFGFSRIPLFLSNIIYWSFDIRFGVGPNANGRTGGAISITLPF